MGTPRSTSVVSPEVTFTLGDLGQLLYLEHGWLARQVLYVWDV